MGKCAKNPHQIDVGNQIKTHTRHQCSKVRLTLTITLRLHNWSHSIHLGGGGVMGRTHSHNRGDNAEEIVQEISKEDRERTRGGRSIQANFFRRLAS